MSTPLVSKSRNFPVMVSDTINCNQVAATYTLFTCPQRMIVLNGTCLVTQTGASFTSVALRVNDSGQLFTIFSAAAGAVANIVAGREISTSWAQSNPMVIGAGAVIEYAIVVNGTAGLIVTDLLIMPAVA